MKKNKTIKPTRIVTFGEGGMDIQLEEEHLCKCGGVMECKRITYTDRVGDCWGWTCYDCGRTESE